MTIFTTLKIAQAIINPCRTLAMMTRMVVAKEANRDNTLRIAVIVFIHYEGAGAGQILVCHTRT
jgi:hypothetical protein